MPPNKKTKKKKATKSKTKQTKKASKTEKQKAQKPKSKKQTQLEKHHSHASEIIAWLGAALAVVSIGFVAYILITGNTSLFSGDRINREQIATNFHTIVLKSEEVNQTADGVETVEQSSELQGVIFDTYQEVKDQAFTLSGKKAKASDEQIVNAYRNFIAAYEQYLEELDSILEKLGTAPKRSFDQSDNFSNTVQSALDNFYTAAGTSIIERIPTEVFALSEGLRSIQAKYQQGLEEAEKAQQAEEQEQRQIAEDEAEVEEHATAFMEAYIEGNESLLRRYVTDAFEAEFNYEVLTEDYRQYSAPTNFRIVDIERNSDTEYTVEGNLAYQSKTSDSQWTNSIVLIIKYDTGYTLWLVDRTQDLNGGTY